MGHLGDVIAFSSDAGLHPTVASLVRQAVRDGLAVSPVQKALFEDIKEELDSSHEGTGPDHNAFRARVSQLRRELLVAPENVLALLDLSQLQLSAGKLRAAERLLRTALALAPNDRIVLRTVARFYVHQGEYDRAHALINRHPATKSDPWLMASEIALADAARKDSMLVNSGRKLIRQNRYPPKQIAELAGALANRELYDGHLKEAREFLRKALIEPTDNVVAQAVMDAGPMDVQLDEPMFMSVMRASSEGQLLRAWRNADQEASEHHAIQWHTEEPFSSRPVLFLTALYSIQGDYKRALNWVQQGLLADSADVGLLRNFAFTQAASGSLDAAELTIRRIIASTPNSDEPYLDATQGLVALRRGQPQLANDFYRKAEAIFEKTNRPDLAALCLANYAKFAAEEHSPAAAKLKAEAEAKVEKYPSIDAVLILSKLSDRPVELPDEKGQRRLHQWLYDAESNTLTLRAGVTAKGAPALVPLSNKPIPTKR